MFHIRQVIVECYSHIWTRISFFVPITVAKRGPDKYRPKDRWPMKHVHKFTREVTASVCTGWESLGVPTGRERPSEVSSSWPGCSSHPPRQMARWSCGIDLWVTLTTPPNIISVPSCKKGICWSKYSTRVVNKLMAGAASGATSLPTHGLISRTAK